MAPPLLTIAALVLRAQPTVAWLPHVEDIVSSFLGPSPNLTLARAVSFDSLKLLDHLWSNSCISSAGRTPGWSLLNFLRSDCDYYRYAFSKALEEATRFGLLQMAEWLFTHFSGVEVGVEVVEAAAAAGHLHILQFLFYHSTFEAYQAVQYEVESMGPRRQYPDDGIVVRWGRADAVRAIENGHADIVRWLIEHTARAHGSRNLHLLMRDAFAIGDLPLAEWLMAHGCPFSAEDALETGQADVGWWLLARGDLQPIAATVEGTAFAIWANGRLEPNRPIEKAFLIWASSGYLDLVQLLVESHAPFIAPNTIWSVVWEEAMEDACDQCRFFVVQWLLEHPMGSTLSPKFPGSVRHAAVKGHLELAQLLHSHGYGGCSAQTMFEAAGTGNLRVVQWIHSQFGGNSSIGLFSSVVVSSTGRMDAIGSAIDAAAVRGHLKVLQFFHGLDESANPRDRKRVRRNGGWEPRLDERKPWATHLAMNGAAAAGHLDVVRWLHSNRSEGCTTKAMDEAAANGHLEVVHWLHSNRFEGCTTFAMDEAAANGHLEVVQWLHANRFEGCTTKAMDDAATCGHLNVLQWLHGNRVEGFSDNALVGAIRGDRLRVVQWLLANSIDQLPGSLCTEYSKKNSFETLLFMHRQDSASICSDDDIHEAIYRLRGSSNFILDWLVGIGRTRDASQIYTFDLAEVARHLASCWTSR